MSVLNNLNHFKEDAGVFKKASLIAFSIFFALSMAIPPVAYANAINMADDPYVVEETPEEINAPAGDCTVTLNYYEIVSYEDPDVPADENGRRFMGSGTLHDMQEGQVLDTWDYVVNIPGYVFFDAWPAKLTVSTNPEDNVIELFYFRLWNNEYTVNYYVMTGADLTADNWGDALATDDVDFIKMGSQTFDNQRFDLLVQGDAYEYELDDMYVIDTYPAEIRVGLNPDNNVINVLYTPELTNLPSEIEVPTDTTPPTTLPGDSTIDKDDPTVTLPGGGSIGSDADNGTLDVTDEMLNDTAGKAEAIALSEAYRSGIRQGSNLVQTGDSSLLGIAITLAVLAAGAVIIAVIMLARDKKNDTVQR